MRDKEDEVIIKKGQHSYLRVDHVDYRALISVALIAVTTVLALLDNDAWREFALMAGMATAWWFRRGK